jgi:hypothetical protein
MKEKATESSKDQSTFFSLLEQGCQMVWFQNKNPNLGKLWSVLQWKMLVYFTYGHLVHFTVFCYVLWTFGIVHGNLVYFSRFGKFHQEKSGNPVLESDYWMATN